MEEEEDGDFNEPMFVQHTEAMLDEIDRMVITNITFQKLIDGNNALSYIYTHIVLFCFCTRRVLKWKIQMILKKKKKKRL